MFDKVLECTSLPTFPTIATELLELTRDPDVGLDDIAKLIMGDQGLAGKVLKTVNSSFYGLSQPCTSIERALGFLGIKAVKSLVLSFSVVRVTEGMAGEGSFDMADYWRRTICAASGARQIAVATKACDPDDAFTAGLFQDMGILACVVAIPSEYEKVVAGAPADHAKLPDHEKQTLGFTHAEVGAALAKKWKLSDLIVQSIRHHHDPEQADAADQPVAKSVALGRMAAEVIAADRVAQPLADLMVKASAWFSRENQQVEMLLDQISATASELAGILDQQIGEVPDAAKILAMANEQLVEQQMQSHRDTAVLEQKAQDLETQTVTDALTGAANRKRFDREIEKCFQQAVTNRTPLSVLFIDADRFKAVNDTHGHQAGDVVLQDIAGRMIKVVGSCGTVCRYGGEEFAVILPKFDVDRGLRFAELLRSAIADKPVDLSQVDGAPPTLNITASFGLGTYIPVNANAATSATQLVQEADRAVYDAKEAGRNCVRLFDAAASGASSPGNLSPPPPSPADGPAAPGDGGLRVLLVEGDPLAAKYLQVVLSSQASVQITSVPSRDAATNLLKRVAGDPSQRPDIVLCEMDLPDGRGLEVLKAVEASPSLESVAVQLITSDAVAAKPSAGGRAQFVSKQTIVEDPQGWARGLIERVAPAITV